MKFGPWKDLIQVTCILYDKSAGRLKFLAGHHCDIAVPVPPSLGTQFCRFSGDYNSWHLVVCLVATITGKSFALKVDGHLNLDLQVYGYYREDCALTTQQTRS